MRILLTGLFIFASTITSIAHSAECKPSELSTLLDNRISFWDVRINETGDENPREWEWRQTYLYAYEGEMINILRAAEFCGDYSVIDKIAKQVNEWLSFTEPYTFKGPPGLKLEYQTESTYNTWLCSANADLNDCASNSVDSNSQRLTIHTLNSAQFLYLASSIINIASELPAYERAKYPNLSTTVSTYKIIIGDHYRYWINKEYRFKSYTECDNGAYTHSQFVNMKLNDYFTDTPNDHPYCDAVTDVDLWIIGGLVEMLDAQFARPNEIIVFNTQELQKFELYLTNALALIEGSLSRSGSFSDFDDNKVYGLVFNAGKWITHPAYDHSGYTGCDIDDPFCSCVWQQNTAGAWQLCEQNIPDAPAGISEDISHARRLVPVLLTLFNNKRITHSNFPSRELMERFANQYAYRVLDIQVSNIDDPISDWRPRFTNFLDGSNGWYRVNYSGSDGFGYGPYDLSAGAITGGYGFLARFNNDVSRINQALDNVFKSTNTEVIDFATRHYFSNWSDAARCFEYTKSSNASLYCLKETYEIPSGKDGYELLYDAHEIQFLPVLTDLTTSDKWEQHSFGAGDGTGSLVYPYLVGRVNDDNKVDIVFVGQNLSAPGLNVRTRFASYDSSSKKLNWVYADDVEGDGDYVHQYPMYSGDFNGDGRTDLLFTGMDWAGIGTGLTLRTKISLGNGKWQHSDFATGDSALLLKYPALVGDFNNDGKDDVVFFRFDTPTSGMNIETWISSGNGTWVSHTFFAGDGAGVMQRPPIIGDVNNDGAADIIFIGANWSANGTNVRVRFSNSDGTWSYASTILSENLDSLENPTIRGDFDGDGRIDFALIGQDWEGDGLNITTAFSNGDGTWMRINMVMGDGNGVHAYPAMVGDVDGDGDDDIVIVGHGWGGPGLNIRTFLSQGNGQWQRKITLTGDSEQAHEYPMLIGDVDGDGRDDLIFIQYDDIGPGLNIRTKLSRY